MEKHQRREIATTLSATLGALSAKVSCLTLGCPFLKPLAQDVPRSRPGDFFRGAEHNYDETHHACLPFEMTLSATSDSHTVERHKWGAKRQSCGLGPVFCYFYVLFKDLHVLGFVSLGRNRLRNTLFTPLKADLDAEASIFNF
ncbi:hypothetical protein LR48_Vigan08g046700 [Vigna angularis]|uniref:Uncharacterized protein n=1 Tax=Phaseolus angularis TaxID=3914 RepID=A0A0L9V3J5_PHAAN|nr:hypothetical protein LR48_Vigan08g046700 [Vigna angularis]